MLALPLLDFPNGQYILSSTWRLPDGRDGNQHHLFPVEVPTDPAARQGPMLPADHFLTSALDVQLHAVVGKSAAQKERKEKGKGKGIGREENAMGKKGKVNRRGETRERKEKGKGREHSGGIRVLQSGCSFLFIGFVHKPRAAAALLEQQYGQCTLAGKAPDANSGARWLRRCLMPIAVSLLLQQTEACC